MLLVGGALQAAIGLDDYSVVRPALAHGMAFGDTEVAEKGDRFRPVPETKVTRRVIQISTVTREQDRNIVRVRPFAHVHTNLAAPVTEEIAAQAPAFQAADVFAVGEEEPAIRVRRAIPSTAPRSTARWRSRRSTSRCRRCYDETAALEVARSRPACAKAAPFLAKCRSHRFPTSIRPASISRAPI